MTRLRPSHTVRRVFRVGVLMLALMAPAARAADPVAPSEPSIAAPVVVGHGAELCSIPIGDRRLLVLSGRVHAYEGHPLDIVVHPVRTAVRAGCRTVVLTNAAGGIHKDYRIGQLVMITDHINLMGWNPLVGPNEPRFAVREGAGLRFFDMTEAYSKRLRSLAKTSAGLENFDLDEGVYLAVSGPSFETPAEIRGFQALGATLVGMSTVPETIVARHMGIEVLGLSCVTNLAAGLGDTPLSHEEVFQAGKTVERRLADLLELLVPQITALVDV